jgi:hypothetical protein
MKASVYFTVVDGRASARSARMNPDQTSEVAWSANTSSRARAATRCAQSVGRLDRSDNVVGLRLRHGEPGQRPGVRTSCTRWEVR